MGIRDSKEEGGKETTQQWLKAKVSVQGLSARDLYASPPRVSWQALCTSSRSKIPEQDLCRRSLCQNAAEDVCTRSLYLRSLYKIFVRHLYARALLARSLQKVSVQGLLARSVYKLSTRHILSRSVRKLSIKDLLVKISAQELLHNQNEHHVTIRVMWEAQSDQRVARAIWQCAPHHNESDPRDPKWREGCARGLRDTTSCGTSGGVCAIKVTKFAGHPGEHLERTPGPNSYRKSAKCGHTVWGIYIIMYIYILHLIYISTCIWNCPPSMVADFEDGARYPYWDGSPLLGVPPCWLRTKHRETQTTHIYRVQCIWMDLQTFMGWVGQIMSAPDL